MRLSVVTAAVALLAMSLDARAEKQTQDEREARREFRTEGAAISVGPRPLYLVEGMDPSPLKDKLLACENDPVKRTNFSIAHRGAPLMFPEHSDVAYRAGAHMGAGIVECDVTFTRDGQLVCRHSECDLATTTNIVATPLNAKCTVPWTGPVGSAHPAPVCCTSDLNLFEYKSLMAKMDASNPSATTAQGYLGGTPSWRTDLYVGQAQVVTFAESIYLNESLGVKHTPELKAATFQDRVNTIFGSQEKYAQKFIDELRAAGVDPKNVYAQSFNLDDVKYWLRTSPDFGRQAVYLDDIDPSLGIPRLSVAELQQVRGDGVRIFAPPMWALLSVTPTGKIVPSQYAQDIRNAGLDIIGWSFERADLRQGASKAGSYYQFDPLGIGLKKDSDMYLALDVLAKDVGVIGMFSDWPGTVSYYASCMGLK